MLDDVLKDLPEDKRQAITEAFEAEKQRGIEESRKKGGDAKKLLTERNALKDRLKDLGLDPDADDLQDRISEYKEKLSGKKGEADNAEWIRKIKTLEEKISVKEKRETELAQKLERKTLTDHLRRAIGERVHASDYVIAGLIRDGKVKLSDDGETPIFLNDSGEEMDFKSGAEWFIKANPSIAINKQAGGGGSGNSGKSGGKSMPQSEWEKMEPIARAKFINGGGVLT